MFQRKATFDVDLRSHKWLLEYLIDEWPENLPPMAHTPNPTIPVFVVSAVAARPQASQGAGCGQTGG